MKTIKAAKKCEVVAEAGDHLSVHYVGRLNDENGKQFDASRDRGQTFNFQLGAGQVSGHWPEVRVGTTLGSDSKARA